jgi:hypothetical protein
MVCVGEWEGRVNQPVASTSSATDSYLALRHSTDPPNEVEAAPLTSHPPQVGFTNATAEQLSAIVASTTGAYPEATTEHKATSKAPRRHLDPELARAIKEAKLKTGTSWRRVAKYTGLSHSYLVQLSNGQRVPSRETVEVLAEWLPIEEWAVEELRVVAGRPSLDFICGDESCTSQVRSIA